MAGLLRCLSTEGRKQGSLASSPEAHGKGKSEEVSADFKSVYNKVNNGVGTAGSSRLLFFIIEKPGEINVELKYRYQIGSAEAKMFSLKCEQ